MILRNPIMCLAGIAGLVLALDQFSKWLVLDVYDLPNRLALDIWPPFLQLRMGWNTGINFGIGGGGPEVMRWILIGLALGISAGLAWWAIRRENAWIVVGAGVVIGGALGNAWDRVYYGAVADFLNMSCCGIVNPFTFNVADIAIFAGALAIVLRA